MRPGLIWGCAQSGARTILIEDGEPSPEDGFRWLHLNLSDQRSERWLLRAIDLPPAIHALFISHDAHQRVLIENGTIGLVLHDFEREFDGSQMSRLGALHVVVTPDLLLTGRYHPTHTADIIKRRIADGARVVDAAAALDLLLGALSDTVATRVLDVTAELLAAEDDFLVDSKAPDTRALVSVRRQSSQLHRMTSGMRAALHRMEAHPGLPKPLLPVAARYSQRLHAIDADIVSAQAQLRLLRDELDLQAAQRTNQNIYLLSIVTALMMPATLVTGFFGMNTGGLPFASGIAGTAGAAILALAASAATYFVLRYVGLVRR